MKIDLFVFDGRDKKEFLETMMSFIYHSHRLKIDNISVEGTPNDKYRKDVYDFFRDYMPLDDLDESTVVKYGREIEALCKHWLWNYNGGLQRLKRSKREDEKT